MIEKKEVSEERYDEMLGALPPEIMGRGGFLVGEPIHHVNGVAVFDMFYQIDGHYFYGGEQTVKAFKEWRENVGCEHDETYYKYSSPCGKCGALIP